MLRKAIGPLLPLAMKFARITMPRNREELDVLIMGLVDGTLLRSR